MRFFVVLAAAYAAAELAVPNVPDEDPEAFVPWDEVNRRPVQFWNGNYSDVKAVSCTKSGDLLFDWAAMKRAMAAWLRDVETASKRVMQTYWEVIRPVQHSLTNIIAYHNVTTNRDCFLGMLSVRLFYLITQSQSYKEDEMVRFNNFVIDWHYYSRKFEWSMLIRSGWGSVIWPSMHLIASEFNSNRPELLWIDCESPLPGVQLPQSMEDAMELINDAKRLMDIQRELVAAEAAGRHRQCPIALAYAAILLASGSGNNDISLEFLNMAQSFVRKYREKNGYTLINLMSVRWPIWHLLAMLTMRVSGDLKVDNPPSCKLLWCPEGGTPNPLTCECETIFQEATLPDVSNVTACFFMVDSRRKSSLRNITSVLNARFWTLAYGVNRLYAEDHGYEIEYVQPDMEAHYPNRKVGWGKVKVVLDRMAEYGPDRCAFGISIDSDAYMRSSESLAGLVHHFGLNDDKLILFSQEYHTELRPDNTFANGGFFIVRNTPAGRGILEEWYNVPENYPDMAHLKKENPQGLNLCWDLKMQPRHSVVVVLAPSYLFTAPLGWFVRHNWFKDMRFEQEMMDIILQKLFRRYGCIMCQNVYDWDDSMNTDPGWR